MPNILNAIRIYKRKNYVNDNSIPEYFDIKLDNVTLGRHIIADMIEQFKHTSEKIHGNERVWEFELKEHYGINLDISQTTLDLNADLLNGTFNKAELIYSCNGITEVSKFSDFYLMIKTTGHITRTSYSIEFFDNIKMLIGEKKQFTRVLLYT